MPTDNELQRLAAAANAIRPDWPIPSLVTHLLNHHTQRTYRDLAVALAWIATDPATNTPARLTESGPWWDATRPTKSSKPVGKVRRCIDHPDQHASHCQHCIDQAVPKPAWFPSFKRRLDTMFAMPADVAPVAETCGICHDQQAPPGRGICADCAARLP
jgi:hypothetical protein